MFPNQQTSNDQYDIKWANGMWTACVNCKQSDKWKASSFVRLRLLPKDEETFVMQWYNLGFFAVHLMGWQKSDSSSL